MILHDSVDIMVVLCQVDKMECESSWYFPGTQLSDHYAIASTIPVALARKTSASKSQATTVDTTPKAGHA